MTHSIKIKPKKQNGYSILELIFYISIFTILVFMVINAMIVMAKSFKETAIQTELVQSRSIMERISREIKQASNIALINTTNLKLNTKDSAGTDKTIEFLLSGSDIQLLEDDVLIGNLNTGSMNVMALSFTRIITPKSDGVKIFLTVKSSNDVLARNRDFYDTVILRGGYGN